MQCCTVLRTSCSEVHVGLGSVGVIAPSGQHGNGTRTSQVVMKCYIGVNTMEYQKQKDFVNTMVWMHRPGLEMVVHVLGMGPVAACTFVCWVSKRRGGCC